MTRQATVSVHWLGCLALCGIIVATVAAVLEFPRACLIGRQEMCHQILESKVCGQPSGAHLALALGVPSGEEAGIER